MSIVNWDLNILFTGKALPIKGPDLFSSHKLGLRGGGRIPRTLMCIRDSNDSFKIKITV